MKAKKRKDITKIFSEGTLIDQALAEAVREALLRHKQAGQPVVEWRKGKIVWIAPEDIKVPEKKKPRKKGKR